MGPENKTEGRLVSVEKGVGQEVNSITERVATMTRDPVEEELDPHTVEFMDKVMDEENGVGIGDVVRAQRGGREGGIFAVRENGISFWSRGRRNRRGQEWMRGDELWQEREV